jgi:hypothetical protein
MVNLANEIPYGNPFTLLAGVGEGVNSEWVSSGWRATRMPQHFPARYVASLIRDGSESNGGVEG